MRVMRIDNEDRRIELGKLVIEGGEIVAEPSDTGLLDLVEDPIFDGKKWISPTVDPEEYLSKLPEIYKSPYLFVEKET